MVCQCSSPLNAKYVAHMQVIDRMLASDEQQYA